MNKKQIEATNKIKTALDELRGKVGEELAKLQDVYNELEAEFDDMSEKSQEGDKGKKLEEQKDYLQEAIDAMDETDDQFSTADSALNSAMTE